MPAPPRPRQPRWMGVVFLLVLAGLLAWNGRAAYRNNKDFPDAEIVRRRSRDLGTLLAVNPMPVVKYTFALYHRLRLLRGKTLVLPERWAAHRFPMERVSRLRVEMTDERFELPIEITDQLYAHADRYWHADEGTAVEVFLDGDATRYVLVERSTGGLALIMSEARYRLEKRAVP